MSSDNSLYDDDEDHNDLQYTSKLQNTHLLINQLESKLQKYISDSEIMQSPSFQHSSDLIYSKQSTFQQQKESQLKSKSDLERELFEFEQRIRRSQISSHSNNSSQIMRTSESFRQTPPTPPPQEDLVVKGINEKIEEIQTQESLRCQSLDSRLQQLKQQQQRLFDEKQSLMRDNILIKSDMDSFKHQLEKQQELLLSQEELELEREMQQKLSQILQSSEVLIDEEKDRKQKFQNDLKSLQFDKIQLLKELDQLNKQQQMLVEDKNEISSQLQNLVQLHSQMLQTDMKKSIMSSSNSSSEVEGKLNMPTHIESLYKLNHQLQQTMNQQLTILREDLEQQKQINKQLINQISEMMHDKVETKHQQVQQESDMVQQQQTQSFDPLPPIYPTSEQQAEIRKDFKSLLQKHKQHLRKFSNPQPMERRNYLKQTAASNQKQRQSKSKSESPRRVLKVKQRLPEYADDYEKHIQNQMQKLNDIVKNIL